MASWCTSGGLLTVNQMLVLCCSSISTVLDLCKKHTDRFAFMLATLNKLLICGFFI
jgi:hypothetical protein